MNSNNYKPMKSRMRASFSAGLTEEPRLEKIDKEGKVLHGVQITLEGEALGHEIWLDRQFCVDVAAAGNSTGDAGVKVRFGHPAMCSDALGTYLGRAKNFRCADIHRKDGSAACGVLADVYLDENADRTEWIMNMAESAPDTFGQSIVFTYADYKVKGAEGEEYRFSDEQFEGNFDKFMEKSADGKLYAVLGKLLGTDFTDTPAATDGVFSDASLAAEASAMLEENPQIREVLEQHPKNVIEFLTRSGLTAVVDAIETKRISGLQSAKDNEISELKKQIATHADELAAKEEELAGKNNKLMEISTNLIEACKSRDQLASDFDNFKLVHQDTVKALEDAEASVEQLKGEMVNLVEELASKREQLEEWKSHAQRHGMDVNNPPTEIYPTLEDGLAKCSTPAERSAFIASGKYRK